MSDVMLLGVLRMPIGDEPDPLTLMQFVDRARQAADRIESDAAEIDRLRAEVAEADRRAGEAERRLADANDSIYKRKLWLSKAKREWGVGDNVSFDVVWDEALKLKADVAALREDADRYRWLVNSGKYTPCVMGDGWAMICGYRKIKPTKAELDAAIDNARKGNAGIHRAAEGRPVE